MAPDRAAESTGRSGPEESPARRGLVQRIVSGHPEDPRWARPALCALLAVTLVLYLWDLSASKYANQFYSAAVQAGSVSWKAFFFGSSDAANSITVDKPPASLWPMALSVRLFGLSSWAILVPEALMGVTTVGVLYAAVRRRFGAAAGLLSAGVLAITPVAALMFRFNNPDAMLCLLMVCAVACVLRALEAGRTKWLVLAGVCFGLGFLTKTLQAWLILPAPVVVYACCAPVRLRRRLGQLLLAGLALVGTGGWWVAIVELLPASARPYVGGSQTNSFLELTFGYNGFGRIDGNERGSVGGGHGGGAGGRGGGWGQTGLTRLFSSDMGGQISWLLPAALILLVVAVCVLWRARRAVAAEQAAQRAEFLVWGGALLMTFTIFSFMSGIFHQYYNIALSPYIAALVGMGSVLVWRRGGRLARIVPAVVVAVTAVWSYVLLDRSPQWLPWLRWTVLVLGLLAALGLLLSAGAGARDGREPERVAGPARRRAGVVAGVAAGLGVATALAGPLAYTLDTINTAKGGSIIVAGPAVQGGRGFPGGGGQKWMFGRGGNKGGMPGGAGGRRAGAQGLPGGQGFPGAAERAARMRGAGGMGGLLDGASVSPAAERLVERNADRYTWAAAAVGSQNAASYQLATQKPVMAIGGFNGSDPSPTLAQFQRYVAAGRIHYFIAGGRDGGGFRGARATQGGAAGRTAPGGGFGGGFGKQGPASQISAWIEKNFKKVTVGGATFYDLTRRKGQQDG
ncbi:glycosyltransferase family 39 protein [Streptomyces sp. BHT-5-2]|uniref:ArnT family glycosyltransferase n=1 Tax=unclassified Streptomyces TaxID=2593676 RepID=UPI001C8D1906|nr:glycosyltransferase family 39 protein [Streptomyces sp. BHT-5-2]QZL03046.1 glycosyltransferase family 39 protein [Streptomyces sp. BHT-5-2]